MTVREAKALVRTTIKRLGPFSEKRTGKRPKKRKRKYY